MFLTQVSF